MCCSVSLGVARCWLLLSGHGGEETYNHHHHHHRARRAQASVRAWDCQHGKKT